MNEPKYGQRVEEVTNDTPFSEQFMATYAHILTLRLLVEHLFGFAFFVLTFLCIVGTNLELWQRLSGGVFAFCVGVLFMGRGDSDE